MSNAIWVRSRDPNYDESSGRTNPKKEQGCGRLKNRDTETGFADYKTHDLIKYMK